MTKRRGVRCTRCTNTTKSVTRICWRCRAADEIPPVHRVPAGISFAGLTFTDAQARCLADSIHDTLEGAQP